MLFFDTAASVLGMDYRAMGNNKHHPSVNVPLYSVWLMPRYTCPFLCCGTRKETYCREEGESLQHLFANNEFTIPLSRNGFHTAWQIDCSSTVWHSYISTLTTSTLELLIQIGSVIHIHWWPISKMLRVIPWSSNIWLIWKLKSQYLTNWE